jgi:hypothetical protein
LYFPNSGDGLDFQYTGTFDDVNYGSSLTIRDLTITTAQSPGATAIFVNGAARTGIPTKPTNILGVTIRGKNNSNYWSNGIYLRDTGTVVIDGVSVTGCNQCFSGSGIVLEGTSESAYPSPFVMSNVSGLFLGSGIYGIGYLQGLAITNGNFTAVDYGLNWTPSLGQGQYQQPQCSITNSQIAARTRAFQITNCNASAIIGNTVSQGQWGGMPNGSPILYLVNSLTTSIMGNTITGITTAGNTPNCIVVAPGSVYNVISGNMFQGCVTNIWMQSGSGYTKAFYNVSLSGSPVFDQGTGDTSVGN